MESSLIKGWPARETARRPGRAEPGSDREPSVKGSELGCGRQMWGPQEATTPLCRPREAGILIQPLKPNHTPHS